MRPPDAARFTEQVRNDLARWTPASARQCNLQRDYQEFVNRDDPVRREAGPEHITVSCFVQDRSRTSVLLALHRKANRWLQLGGHLEGADLSPVDAALREAREEGGIHDLDAISRPPVDLDRHELRGDFGHCRVHWDIGYAAFADRDNTPVASSESLAVAWWPIDRIRASGDTQLADRVEPIAAG